MTTKRKPAPEDPVKATKKLVVKIRKELSCTEAEAYFTLRCLANPPGWAFFERRPEVLGGPPQNSPARALSFTKDFLTELDEYRKRVEGGDFAAFLRALEVCGIDGFPIPKWMRERIGKARAAYSSHKAATLDEAFNARRPRNYRQGAAQERYDKAGLIGSFCSLLKRQGVTIGGGGPFEVGPVGEDGRLIQVGEKGDGLFEIAAKEFSMSTSKVRNYYYAWKNLSHTPHPADVLLEPFKVSASNDRPKRRGRPPGKKGGKKTEE